MSLINQFLEDLQGRRFRKTLEDPNIPFRVVLELLDKPDPQRRMEESVTIHNRPALAGVVKELEALPEVNKYFETTDGHETERFRQAVGVAVRIVMENRGFKTTGQKGLLGVRVKVPPHTTTPGAYHNEEGSLSKWFNRAEKYERRKD